MHGGGSVVLTLPGTSLWKTCRGEDQRVAGGQVAGLDGNNLQPLGPLPKHVKRLDEGIRVEARVAGIVAPGGGLPPVPSVVVMW